MCMSPLYMKNTSEQWLQHNIGGIFLNSIINLYLKFNFKWFFFPFPIGSLQWLICYWRWISVVFSNMAGSFAFMNLKQIRANILQHSYDSDVWNFHKIRAALFFTTLRIFRQKQNKTWKLVFLVLTVMLKLHGFVEMNCENIKLQRKFYYWSLQN